jgi:hypothetical protein
VISALEKRNVVLERALEASQAEGRAASIVAVLVARSLTDARRAGAACSRRATRPCSIAR